MNSCTNKVILLGGNHHNGLGLVRSFGRHGVRPYGIIIGKGADDSFVAQSKYWERTWAAATELEALEILLSAFPKEHNKPLLIPWSDGAAELIDSNFNQLEERFLLPSIQKRQGAIVDLMNKEKQIEFAKQFGLKMLPSHILMLNNCMEYEPQYPVILKPVTSIEGGKSDMFICQDEDSYAEALKALKSRGFERILVQKYLPERTEYVLTGAISEKRYSYSVVKHLRQWPPNFGTGSFSETAVRKDIDSFCMGTMESIKEAGFTGTIDFEFFESNTGELFLNEINWRSSGRNFVSKLTGVESAYLYYCDLVNIPFESKTINDVHVFSMNDATDVKHVFNKDITLSKWLSDLKKTKSFAVYDLSDMRPVVKRYGIMLRQFLKGDMRI